MGHMVNVTSSNIRDLMFPRDRTNNFDITKKRINIDHPFTRISNTYTYFVYIQLCS